MRYYLRNLSHLGDVVGYCGPYPNECLELVREEFDYILSGNHDRMVSTESVDEKYQERSWLNEGIVKSIELSSSGTREFLRDTPEEMNITLDGEDVFITHSHPFEEDGYLYGEDFEEIYEEIDVDYMFVGHTHEQSVRHFEDGFVVNPGSVGMPKKGFDDGRYAVWDDGEITFHSFDYDRGDLISDCREVGLSEEVIEPFL